MWGALLVVALALIGPSAAQLPAFGVDYTGIVRPQPLLGYPDTSALLPASTTPCCRPSR